MTGLPVLASIVLNDDTSSKGNTSHKKSSSKKSNIKRNEHIEQNNNKEKTISMFSYLNEDYSDNNSDKKE